MLRMEIVLFMVLAFVACVYFSAGRKNTPLHRTFSLLLVVVLIHLALDGITVYTVNHLDAVPRLLNDAVHRLFLGSMVLVIYLFYQYIVVLEEETGKPRRLDWAARAFLAVAACWHMSSPPWSFPGSRGTNTRKMILERHHRNLAPEQTLRHCAGGA